MPGSPGTFTSALAPLGALVVFGMVDCIPPVVADRGFHVGQVLPALIRLPYAGTATKRYSQGPSRSRCLTPGLAHLFASQFGRLRLASRPLSAATAQPRVELRSAGDQR